MPKQKWREKENASVKYWIKNYILQDTEKKEKNAPSFQVAGTK